MQGIPIAFISWRATVVWKERSEFNAARAKAEALFKKRCESAGEFFSKMVPNVKGIVWMKWHDRATSDADYQFELYDPYGRDCGENECIKNLLRSTSVVSGHNVNSLGLPARGYEFVETTDPHDGQTYRYVAGAFATAKRLTEMRAIAARNNNGIDPGEDIIEFAMKRQPISTLEAKYGITWDDISTREDRVNWIAGGSITVTDLQTNEVIAKREGYMTDPGMGSTAGSRNPWGFAGGNSRPAAQMRSDRIPVSRQVEKTAFLFKALQPTTGETK